MYKKSNCLWVALVELVKSGFTNTIHFKKASWGIPTCRTVGFHVYWKDSCGKMYHYTQIDEIERRRNKWYNINFYGKIEEYYYD